jgi:hypothetical protein
MDLQYLDLKLPLEQPERPDLGAFIPVFHRWVREQLGEGLLIDVADYRHVFAGPGVVLIGYDCNYSLDMTHNRPGLRCIRKTAVAGGARGALTQGLRALNRARTLLEQDAAFAGSLRFSRQILEVRVNDRLLAPNRPETFEALRPDLTAFFETLTGSGGARLEFHPDARETFRVTVHAAAPLFAGNHAA